MIFDDLLSAMIIMPECESAVYKPNSIWASSYVVIGRNKLQVSKSGRGGGDRVASSRGGGIIYPPCTAVDGGGSRTPPEFGGSGIYWPLVTLHVKGQLISKAIYGLLTSPKKEQTNLLCSLFYFSQQTNQNRLFIVLENLRLANLLFNSKWPLVTEACYYSGNQVLGGVTIRDMSLN